MADMEQLLDAVLRLPPQERAQLAREIIRSLDEPTDSGASATWVSEIEKRYEEVRDGTVELLDWDVVRARLQVTRDTPRRPHR